MKQLLVILACILATSLLGTCTESQNEPTGEETLNKLALMYATSGEHDKAIQVLKEVVAMNPKNFKAYTDMGMAYSFLNEKEQAIECFKTSISINPAYGRAYTYLGMEYSLKAEDHYLDEAILLLEKAIEIDPEDAMAYQALGSTYGRKGDLEKAVESLKKANSLMITK